VFLSNIFNEFKALSALELKFQSIYALGQQPDIIAGRSSASGKEARVTAALVSIVEVENLTLMLTLTSASLYFLGSDRNLTEMIQLNSNEQNCGGKQNH
jgi:hypothetical protein